MGERTKRSEGLRPGGKRGQAQRVAPSKREEGIEEKRPGSGEKEEGWNAEPKRGGRGKKEAGRQCRQTLILY